MSPPTHNFKPSRQTETTSIKPKMMLPINQSHAVERSTKNPQIETKIESLTIETSSPSSSAFEKQQAVRAQLGAFDILCGRSSTAFNNAGNKRFRAAMNLRLTQYINAPTRHAKSILIRQIVERLRENEGARFLTFCHKTGDYVELGEKKAREKVGHALRDMATQQGLHQREQQQQPHHQEQQQQSRQQPAAAGVTNENETVPETAAAQTTSDDASSSFGELFSLFEHMEEEEMISVFHRYSPTNSNNENVRRRYEQDNQTTTSFGDMAAQQGFHQREQQQQQQQQQQSRQQPNAAGVINENESVPEAAAAAAAAAQVSSGDLSSSFGELFSAFSILEEDGGDQSLEPLPLNWGS